MKKRTEYDLNAFAATLLGMFGICIILIPARMHPVLDGVPGWVTVSLSLLAYALFLYFQYIGTTRGGQGNLHFHALNTLVLCGFAALFFRAGLLIESAIIFSTGLVNLLYETSFAIYLKKVGTINAICIASGLASALSLLISRKAYLETGISHYYVILVFSFLITSIFGIISIFITEVKTRDILSRLHAVAWLIWFAILAPSMSAAHLIAPGLLVMITLSTNHFPWEKLTLPKNDILGHRVLMTGGTIAFALFIFLSALLSIADLSNSTSSIVNTRDAAFISFILILIMIYYEISTIIMTINGLVNEMTRIGDDSAYQDPLLPSTRWNRRLLRYIKPFIGTQERRILQLNAQADQVEILSTQLLNEKKRNSQLILLNELSHQLENQLDQPVSAQLAVNTLERALNCSLVSLFIHEPDQREFMLLASAGNQTNMIPAGYRQDISVGAIGRAVRQRKTQVINDIRLDSDFIPYENETSLSCVIIPMIFNGYVNGIITLNSEKANAFGSIEIGMAEAVANNLSRAWERSGYHLRLMNLIQAGSQLSAMVDPETTAREIASIAREILNARFTFVHIQLGQEGSFTQSASSGEAPNLLNSLEGDIQTNQLVQATFRAEQPFRVRDVRKYSTTSKLDIDHAGLRSMIAIPIRWHRVRIGSIFAFGKQNEVFFSENDESIAELLSIQAAGAFESTWLQLELRSSLRSTSLLYRLSTQIIQAESLHNAAVDIAQTAHKLSKGISTGIVLFAPDGRIEADVEIDTSDPRAEKNHPMKMIEQVMESGQLMYMSQGHSVTRACLPIQTPIRKYGALWTSIPDDNQHKPTNPADLQTLVNQAAIALERSLLLVESQRQAHEIKAAYDMLEDTYDQTLAALVSALDARDRETEGHSLRVSRRAAKLGTTLGFSSQQLKVLERGSLLHDIGKIGISDTILHKPGPLNEKEWKIMRLHPDIGAGIVEKIPFLDDTIPLIRHHQERWNGTGYPDGLKGEEIPILARMFAIVDAFDALTSNRPYRTKISDEEALQYLREEAGILFDPGIVEIFIKMMLESEPEQSTEN